MKRDLKGETNIKQKFLENIQRAEKIDSVQ